MKSQDLLAIRELPVQELKVQLHECEEKLFKLRIGHAISPLKNGLQLQHLRRHRARLLTWIRQKSALSEKPKAGAK